MLHRAGRLFVRQRTMPGNAIRGQPQRHQQPTGLREALLHHENQLMSYPQMQGLLGQMPFAGAPIRATGSLSFPGGFLSQTLNRPLTPLLAASRRVWEVSEACHGCNPCRDRRP